MKWQSGPGPSQCHDHVWLFIWCSFLLNAHQFYTTYDGIQNFKSTFSFCLVTPYNIFSKVLGVIKMFFVCDISETSLCVLFSQQWFSPWNCPMDAIFARCLSYCYNYFLAHLSLDSFFLSINEIIIFFSNTFCIYSGYLSLILPFVDMKDASVKNMKQLELENGARSLLMGCLFLLATFFF